MNNTNSEACNKLEQLKTVDPALSWGGREQDLLLL